MKINPSKKLIYGLLLFGVLMAIITANGQAQQTPSFSNSINEFQQTTSQLWRAQALMIGRRIFGVLAVINVLILGITIVFDNFQAPPLNLIITDLLLLGFFFAVLNYFDSFDAIIYGFKQIAHAITGVDSNLTSTGIFWDGLYYLSKTWGYALGSYSIWGMLTGMGGNPVSGLIVLLSGVIIFIGFAGMAIQYAFITIEAIIYLIFGPIFLAFLPLKPLRPMAEGFIADLFEVGIKYLVFYVIMGFAFTIIGPIINELNEAFTYSDFFDFSLAFELGFMAMLTVFLLGKLPSKFAKGIAPSQVRISNLIPNNTGL